jgi:hypothetical protein
MLQRLTLKLFSLVVLCAALMSVASAPRPVAKGVFCMDAPLEMGCSSGTMCCVEYDSQCLCA